MLQRFLVFAVAILILGECGTYGPRTIEAGCRVKTNVVKTEVVNTAIVATDIVAVPLAVSVGVPVAQVTPYYYSYSAYAASGAAVPLDLDALATKVVEKLRAAGPIPQPSPPPVNPAPTPAPTQRSALSTLIEQRCATCHSGPEPKSNFSLENPLALDCPSRLKAIRAVLSEKMPKGGPRLTAEEAGQILEELVGP
jgi:hypothetical protein